MAFVIEITQPARQHLKDLRKRDQQIILDTIEEQLSSEPDRPTRHRKQLLDNAVAPWELRVGDFRVFYDIHHDNDLVVILAVGEKTHNRLRIGSKEIEL